MFVGCRFGAGEEETQGDVITKSTDPWQGVCPAIPESRV